MMRFQKTYTRDTTIIIQEMWPYHLKHGLKGVVGEVYEDGPVTVDYIYDGAIEVWENLESLEFTKSKLTEASFEKKDLILSILDEYEARPKEFKEHSLLDDLASFKVYLAGVEKYMLGDLLLSSFADLDTAQSDVHKKSVEMRSADHYFASNDRTIRDTIAHLFPSYKDLAICVRRNELDALPSLDECKARLEHFVVASDGYSRVESLSSYAQSHSKVVFEIDTPTGMSEVRGEIAMSGKATGTVRLVRRIMDMAKVGEGDIIVSPMTTPAMLPAMHKALAFVTDEGGVLCHAAVVARELKKPCVIGTKFATQIFRDGDTVEVDANNGIVKKI